MLEPTNKNLEQRISDRVAWVTVNNAYNEFLIRLPNAATTHWSSHAGPALQEALAAFDANESLKSLTFSQLKVAERVVFDASLEGLNFIIKYGGRV